MKKTLSVLIIFLFLLSSSIPITLSNETNMGNTFYVDENGTLSGYVKDTSMNPIGGAKVRVYFHETYEENYTEGPWDGTQEHPFQYIQDGVYNASNGDTIYVFNRVLLFFKVKRLTAAKTSNRNKLRNKTP